MGEPALERPYARLGLKPVLLRELLAEHAGVEPWRVTAVERGLCALVGLDADGAVISRRVRCGAQPLAVGDWVVLDDAPDETARVVALLERHTVLRRASAGRATSEQLVAANLDTVFVVAAFAETAKLERRSINARRFDRFVLAVRDGGATPVVLLNKIDLTDRGADDLDALRVELSARLGGIDVVCVSAFDAGQVGALEAYLHEGETVAFVGPSGVGKSSLINAMLGEQQQAVGAVRDLDAKGRHTTTRRELIVLPSGALLIDTPGVRQFAVLLDSAAEQGFEDIAALAEGCRFGDCGHQSEPGCTVRAAVEAGELSADRLGSFLGLKHEAERLRLRHDAYARHLDRKEMKRFGRMVREAQASKKRRSD